MIPKARHTNPGLSLLLVEDDAVDRIAVRRASAASLPQARLVEVATVTEALAALNAEPIDCVLADYRLAGEDALDLLFELESRFGDHAPPVVILTGKGNEPLAVEAMKRGVADYLIKRELSPDLLRRSIDAVLSKRRYEMAAREQQIELAYFTTMAANDLRAPLHGLVLQSEDFARQHGEILDPACRAYRNAVRRSAAYMLALLDGMLAYSLLQPGRLRFAPVEMKSVVEDVLDTLATEIETAHARIEIGPLPAVHGDRARLAQVIQNLTINALSAAGGKPARIRFSGVAREDHWRIEVADRGIGIDAALHEQIFLPLRRPLTPAVEDGAGLGLAICRRIVEPHGGRIWVRSAAGQGATFVFTIAMPESGLV
jgi:signal transduction histidine kinase